MQILIPKDSNQLCTAEVLGKPWGGVRMVQEYFCRDFQVVGSLVYMYIFMLTKYGEVKLLTILERLEESNHTL